MTFDPSERLSAESRALLDAAGDGDAPSAADQARVRAGIARRLALGVAAGAVVATTAKTAAAGAAAATSGAAGASVGSGAAGVTAGASSTIGAGAAAAASGAIVGTTTATAGVASGAGAAAGSAAAFGLAGTGTKILAAIAIASAIGGGTMTYRHTRSIEASRAIASASTTEGSERNAAPRPLPARARSPVARAATVDAPSAIAPGTALPSSASPALPAVSGAHANAVTGATPLRAGGTNGIAAAPSSSSADTSGDLVAELALLREVHAALQDGDGARALALLSDHARRFPGGALTEEREASRVLALCNVGRIDEARDAASRFLREHPRSPQTDRVAHACDARTTF